MVCEMPKLLLIRTLNTCSFDRLSSYTICLSSSREHRVINGLYPSQFVLYLIFNLFISNWKIPPQKSETIILDVSAEIIQTISDISIWEDDILCHEYINLNECWVGCSLYQSHSAVKPKIKMWKQIRISKTESFGENWENTEISLVQL